MGVGGVKEEWDKRGVGGALGGGQGSLLIEEAVAWVAGVPRHSKAGGVQKLAELPVRGGGGVAEGWLVGTRVSVDGSPLLPLLLH